jgi:hypothetical protein
LSDPLFSASAPTHELANRVPAQQRTEAHLMQGGSRGLFGAAEVGLSLSGTASIRKYFDRRLRQQSLTSLEIRHKQAHDLSSRSSSQ